MQVTEAGDVTVDAAEATPGDDGPDGMAPDGHRTRASPWMRRLVPIMIGVTILPIWYAVVHNGVRGLFPYDDGATTVLRARDVFGGPFPLVGMSAAGGSRTGFDVFFPAAWQLYVIAVPTRILGVVWGPLVAMGLLNTVWVLLAAWLLIRRLRLAEAMVGLAFIAVLLWSMGSGFMITPIPMEMLILPMALFLIAVWAATQGDAVGIWVLALVANYMWLDHLVLVVSVPVIAVAAVVGFVLWYRRTRRRGDDESRRALRSANRGLIAAGVITVVMWIPPLIQQFTTSPGNLRLLIASAGTDRPTLGSWPAAVRYVFGLIGRPPFWFRGSLERPGYVRRSIGGSVVEGLPLLQAVVAVVVVALGVWLGVLAWRRRDRAGLWLLIVAGVALVASLVTAYSAPTYLGPPSGYLRAMWAVAMFVWMAIVINLIRLARGRIQWSAAAPAMAVIAIFTVLNLPTSSYGYDGKRMSIPVIRKMIDQVVPQLQDQGTFRVDERDLAGHRYGAALRLAMAVQGVPYCLADGRLRIDGEHLECPDHLAGMLGVAVVDGRDEAVEGRVLFRHALLNPEERRDLQELDDAIGDWLDTVGRLQLTPEATEYFEDWAADSGDPGVLDPVWELLEVAPAEVRADPLFADLVFAWYGLGGVPDTNLFLDSPLSVDQWRSWIQLTRRADVVMVYEKPLPKGS